MAVRREVDFAAVAEEKLAIFIARRKKLNFTAVTNKKWAIFRERRKIKKIF